MCAAFITAEISQAKFDENRKNAKNRAISEACSSAQERNFENVCVQFVHLESFYSTKEKKCPELVIFVQAASPKIFKKFSLRVGIFGGSMPLHHSNYSPNVVQLIIRLHFATRFCTWLYLIL